MVIDKASDLVKDGEMAVVVFTKGDNFLFDGTGNGETGHWVVDKNNLDSVNRVIVYLRGEYGINLIYRGNYAGCRPSPEKGRLIIKFRQLTQVGTTASNWLEFAGAGQNPVSYVGDFE